MGTVWSDLRHGVRLLTKTPGLTVVAVVTLTLGIGANTALFSVVNAFLFRPLPVRAPEQLVLLAVSQDPDPDLTTISYPDYRDYREQSRGFSDLIAYVIGFAGLSTDTGADRIAVCYVTGNYFTMLGVEPAAGRLLSLSEGERPGADPVMVLGHAYWRRRFGGDSSIVGKGVRVNGLPYQVVGIAPEGFHGTYAIAEMDAYIPLAMAATTPDFHDLLERRDKRELYALGRLSPGVTPTQAEATLAVVARRLESQYPETNKGVRARVLRERLARPEPRNATSLPLVALIFMGLVGMVLLVACVNVTSILLVRVTARQKEISVRAALGAERSRLIRQLLTETVPLALLGGLAGALLGSWVCSLLSAIRFPGDQPIRLDFAFDGRVFGYTLAVVLLVGAVVGLLPARRATRADVNDALRGGRHAQETGPRFQRLRDGLVVAQLAASMLLMCAAGLFVRSLQKAYATDLGFEPQGLLNLSMDPSAQGHDEAATRRLYAELEERVRSLPGVEAATLAHSVPLGYWPSGTDVLPDGMTLAPDEMPPSANYNTVGLGYFRTLRIPLLRGREFTPEDGANSPRVAVVNEIMAERLWPREDALGKHFHFGRAGGPKIEVVGVAQTGKYGYFQEEPRSFFYVPLAQQGVSLLTLQIRTSREPLSLAPAVRNEIRRLDPNLPVFDVMTMDRSLQGGSGFLLFRYGALFATVLGSLGLLLTVIGIYGVVAYSVVQRTHELGIRMALGARPRDILGKEMRRGGGLVTAGLGLGLALALGASRILQSLLYGVAATDLATLALVSALTTSVALAACWFPARRASRVDPLVALRDE